MQTNLIRPLLFFLHWERGAWVFRCVHFFWSFFSIVAGCANKTCDLYAVCHGDGFGNGLCQCPTSCEQIPNADDKEQVCGTDGQTYPSECHLKMEACRKQQFIVVANYGNCGECCLTFHSTYSWVQLWLLSLSGMSFSTSNCLFLTGC